MHGKRSPAASPLEGSVAVVVAHPDDEALWLSSILGAAERIVFCFGDPFDRPRTAAARRRALALLPLEGVAQLGIAESGARFLADWAHPRLTPAGIEILDPAAGARYEANFGRLVESLRAALAGFRNVCTHSPWGEYGHAEHIQVHRAVAALQGELGYTLWFPNYVGRRSWPLARQLGDGIRWSERRVLRPDLAIARRLKRIYSSCGAWTWTRAHRWPRLETLYALPPADDGSARSPLSGENLLDVAFLKWWSLPWRTAQRVLQ